MSAEIRPRLDAEYAPDLEIIEVDATTATVATAAAALDVEPGQIAKTLAVRVRDHAFLLVTRGDARLDNRKCKAEFGDRPRMLNPDETLRRQRAIRLVESARLACYPITRLSRRLATAVRDRISRRRLAQHLGPHLAAATVRAGRRALGRFVHFAGERRLLIASGFPSF